MLVTLATVAALSNAFAGFPADARITTYKLDIPAQSLDSALQAFALASHHRLLYKSSLVEGQIAPALKGEFTAEEALNTLLSGAPDLTFEVTPSAVVLIMPKSDKSASVPISGAAQQKQEKEKSRQGDSFRLAPAVSGQAAGPNAGAPQEEPRGRKKKQALKEIVVTAEKRGEERLQDVPVPITVISAESLVDVNQLRIQDYYTHFPNLSVAPSPDVGDSQILEIRGITTGEGSNPTVGIVIDDVPFGSSTQGGGGNTIPDFDPSDLEQIEVLRGPQGTLYGADSMGGLIRYVTRDPSTTGETGRVQVGFSDVENAATIGYVARAAANVPVSDTVAVRASAYTREDPGYIDNPVLGIDGVNRQIDFGGRVAGLWRPSDALTAKFSALYQRVKTDGSSNVTVLPGLGDLQQNFIPGIGAFDQTLEAYSLTLTGKIGSSQLTSLTGYNRNQFTNSLDFSYLYGPLAKQIFGPAFSDAGIFANFNTGKLTQEMRVLTPVGSRLLWQVGVFYTAENTGLRQDYLAENATTRALAGSPLIAASSLDQFYELAGFTNLTVTVTDQLDVQIGGRESATKGVANYQIITGALYGSAIRNPETQNRFNSFTYLLTPRYRFNPNLMVYARLASGYRPGGGVSDPAPTSTCVVLHLPCAYAPDKTKNYEVGAKGDFLHNMLTFDASLYYIDWTGIQILLTAASSGFPYTVNGGTAKSQGAELSVESRPLRGLTISAWVTLSDAVLTQDLPVNGAVYGRTGDRLPDSSRRSGNLAIERDFALTASARGFVGGTVSYMGDMEGVFQPTADRQHFGGYTKLDVHAGADWNSWEINFYLNNALDKRAAIGGGLGTFPPYAFAYIQPRNFGVSVAKAF